MLSIINFHTNIAINIHRILFSIKQIIYFIDGHLHCGFCLKNNANNATLFMSLAVYVCVSHLEV